MPTWILRKNVDDERLGEPHACAGPNDIQRVLGVLTIDEYIATMLEENELVEPDHGGSRRILNGSEVVGYIVVLSSEDP
jgi:hypothetical protein